MKEMEPSVFSRRALAGTVFLILLAAAMTLTGCGKTKVSPEYDALADAAIVTVWSGGGLPFPGDDLSPLFRLYGDGKVVRFAEEEDGSLGDILVQGRLGKENVEELLRRLVNTGFFSLEDEYKESGVYDATYRRIAVDLAETDKAVTVWYPEKVTKFDAAYELILGYPVGDTAQYVPDKGYLVVTRERAREGGEYDILDPASEIYGLLPDRETLNRAADAHTAVAVDGSALLSLKKYEKESGIRGLLIAHADCLLAVYPVYEPRTADKP